MIITMIHKLYVIIMIYRLAGRFANHELADMHMAYGAAEVNGRAALRMYTAKYPLRQHPHQTTFANIRFVPHMNDTGRPRQSRTRAIAAALGLF